MWLRVVVNCFQIINFDTLKTTEKWRFISSPQVVNCFQIINFDTLKTTINNK